MLRFGLESHPSSPLLHTQILSLHLEGTKLVPDQFVPFCSTLDEARSSHGLQKLPESEHTLADICAHHIAFLSAQIPSASTLLPTEATLSILNCQMSVIDFLHSRLIDSIEQLQLSVIQGRQPPAKSMNSRSRLSASSLASIPATAPLDMKGMPLQQVLTLWLAETDSPAGVIEPSHKLRHLHSVAISASLWMLQFVARSKLSPSFLASCKWTPSHQGPSMTVSSLSSVQVLPIVDHLYSQLLTLVLQPSLIKCYWKKPALIRCLLTLALHIESILPLPSESSAKNAVTLMLLSFEAILSGAEQSDSDTSTSSALPTNMSFVAQLTRDHPHFALVTSALSVWLPRHFQLCQQHSNVSLWISYLELISRLHTCAGNIENVLLLPSVSEALQHATFGLKERNAPAESQADLQRRWDLLCAQLQ